MGWRPPARVALGVQPLGGTPLRDAPTVDLTLPSLTVTTGGPYLNVSWDYSQGQSQPQNQFRVWLTNNAGTVEYYDSGWRAGQASFWAVNLVAEGVPTETSDLSVHVGARFDDDEPSVTNEATDVDPLSIAWGVVSVTVLEPEDDETIFTDRVTVEWLFASTRSKTQGSWRVRVRAAASQALLYDSSWQLGTNSSFEVPYPLKPGTYLAQVDVANSEGVTNE